MACPEAELSIVITDDASIRKLNRTWRGKDTATDVLSFSQVEAEAGAVAREADQRLLGDVVISAETAARQAEQIGHCFEAEVRRLLAHGILHLLGHDHVRGGPQARRMKTEERRLLKLLDEAVPVAEG